MKTLLIDNYDSYTHILAQCLWEVNGEKPLVVKNDELPVEAIRGLEFDNIVISPGPGHPGRASDFGVCMRVFDAFPDVPILGVCLGHQGLGLYAGAKIRHAPRIVHGEISTVVPVRTSGLFRGLPPRFHAVRYHSFVIDRAGLPDRLEVLARTVGDGLIMAVRVKDRPWYGLQFHPESAGTEHGLRILRNFRDLTREWKNRKPSAPGDRLFSDVLGWTDPEVAFGTLFADESLAFWLDSSRPGRDARFSFMGAASEVFESRGLDFYRGRIAARPVREDGRLPFEFRGGLVGFLGYEMKGELGYGRVRGRWPGSLMMRADRFLAFDHLKRRVYACAVGRNQKALSSWTRTIKRRLSSASPAVLDLAPLRIPSWKTPRVRKSDSRAAYLRKIRRLSRLIRDGETYEACLTNRFFVPGRADPWRLYRVLRRSNPAPYSAYLKFPQGAVLCSSPELFLRCSRSGGIVSEPIKGTRAKGRTRAETGKIARELASSPKDRAELLMIVDLIRNDLGRVCRKGSVRVRDFVRVTEHATVLQLSSVISGLLDRGRDAFDLVGAAFPGGSVTGAPKKRTLEILEAVEGRPRGVYTGSVGYFSYGGAAALNIAIRTLVAEKGGINFGSGGAVTSRSNPSMEYLETLVKAYPLLRAVCLEKYGEFGYDKVVETTQESSVRPRDTRLPSPSQLRRLFGD